MTGIHIDAAQEGTALSDLAQLRNPFRRLPIGDTRV